MRLHMKIPIIAIAVISVVIGSILQLLLEREHKVDSLGVWYTVLCSAIYSLVIFGLVMAIRYWMVRRSTVR